MRLSSASKVARLDPKYDKMVDRAMKNTPQADPDRVLKRLKPFPKDHSLTVDEKSRREKSGRRFHAPPRQAPVGKVEGPGEGQLNQRRCTQ